MSTDVIIGRDGKPRCAWVDASDPASARYHDEVWGTKSQGYRFVGPTSVYAFMQNVGVVNDHVHECFRATDYTTGAGHR